MSEGTIAEVLSGAATWCVVTGDCREVMAGLPDKSVDHVITDPPYGTEDLGGGYGRRQLVANDSRTGHTILGDKDLRAWSDCATAAPRVLRAPAWLVFFCAPRRRNEAENIAIGAGFSAVGEFVWEKPPGLGYTIRYSHETAVVHSLGKAKANHTGLSVLRGERSERAMAERHPHEKPESVMAHLVVFASGPDQIILDPFCGSGTTGVAALRLGRRFIGIEKNEKHVTTARARLRAEEAGSTLQAQRAGQVAMFGGRP